MSLGNLVNRDIVTISPNVTIAEAARLMDLKNIGCLIVLDEGKLVGILTDRDIVLRVVNLERNPKAMTVREAMSSRPEVLDADIGLMEALEKVRGKAMRRFPVVDRYGRVVGIFTVDDVVRMLGKELSAIVDILERERALV